ncbi:hypothetical protein [Burkholderia pyrrocinia]
MATCLPDLEWIWVNTTDAQLAELCRDYPALYRYVRAMDEADRRNPAVRSRPLRPLPEPLKTRLRALLTAAATLKLDYQSTQEIGHPQSGQSDLQQLGVVHQIWTRESDAFATRLRRRDVPDHRVDFLTQTLAQLGEHIAQVAKRSERNTGLARRPA